MSSLKAKRVLLIGGAGFIGQKLMSSCRSVGMKVLIVDSVIPAKISKINDIEVIQGDYRNPGFLHEIVDRVDYVVHLAHEAVQLDAACDMSVEIERNIMPAIQLMDICISSNILKLLFVSSGGTVYGNPLTNEPISENALTRPVSVYGTTKLMIENLGFLYFAQQNLPFIVARPGNAYGQGQLPFRGQGFIATAFASAKLGRPMRIFGDGTVVRDYVHVVDIADAIVALLEHGQVGEAYNIGTACGTSLHSLIDDFIAPIISKEGHSLNCNYESERKVDVGYNVLLNNKLSLDTGFTPGIKLYDGLQSTWDWIKINTNGDSKCQ